MNKETAEKTGVLGRRSERVLLKIPIKVKGTSAEGKPFDENTCTLVINRHGARITLQTPLQPDARITITNLYNNLTSPFRVVARTGRSLGEGPEWGVECLEPDAHIWGIYFPRKKDKAGEEEPIDALLECSKCSSRELAQLGPAQYQTLTTTSSFRRECRHCKTTTEWQFSFVEEAWELAPVAAESAEIASAPTAAQPAAAASTLAPAPASASPATPSPPSAPTAALPATPAPSPALAPAIREERRRVKRVALKLPVRVRLEDGRQDIIRTENYSKSGACIISTLDLNENDKVLLTIGYAGGSSDLETPARVVWRRPLEGTKMTAYGMEFLKSSDPPRQDG
jgi:hypothetical protein